MYRVTLQCVIGDLNLMTTSLFMYYRESLFSSMFSNNSEAETSELKKRLVVDSKQLNNMEFVIKIPCLSRVNSFYRNVTFPSRSVNDAWVCLQDVFSTILRLELFTSEVSFAKYRLRSVRSWSVHLSNQKGIRDD